MNHSKEVDQSSFHRSIIPPFRHPSFRRSVIASFHHSLAPSFHRVNKTII
jgi:hypothetical protein